jgi:hypothetical protein
MIFIVTVFMVIMMPLALAQKCDTFDFSPFSSWGFFANNGGHVEATLFQVTTRSVLSGALFEVGGNASAIIFTLYAGSNSSNMVSVSSYNHSGLSGTDAGFFTVRLKEAQLNPGTFYALGVYVYPSSVGISNYYSKENIQFPLGSTLGNFNILGAQYCEGVRCAPNFPNSGQALLTLAPVVCNLE